MGMLQAILSTGLGIIDKVIPDPKAKAEAKERLVKLAQDGKLKEMQAELQDIADARAHDKAAYGGGVVDFFRGMVRPVITMGAFGFYVYSKIEGVPLTVEDYSIVGMVLAFWFGGKFIGKDARQK